ncbi:hypothetical protein FV219_04210 [Methylobacterium sp. WL122]|nr:hypothetical protein FV219_04210 [Methylobacterium sp. WL122]
MLNRTENAIDQRGASADGDVVGRDKISFHSTAERRNQIDGWLERLDQELRDSPQLRGFVDNLQYYMQDSLYDSVIGLEAKLQHSGRSKQIASALRKKEAFTKLLDEWQAYPAAQEIIAYFLSKIDATFNSKIEPRISTVSADEIDAMILDEIVDKVLREMGCGPFMLNHNNVSGMFYWLAHKCYVRWHV